MTSGHGEKSAICTRKGRPNPAVPGPAGTLILDFQIPELCAPRLWYFVRAAKLTRELREREKEEEEKAIITVWLYSKQRTLYKNGT